MKYTINKEKLRYIKNHWKLGFHLIFHTRHFGVNNRWWDLPWPGSTIFGWPWWKRLTLLWPPNLIRSVKLVKWRMAPGIAFVPEAEYKLCWEEPWFKKDTI